MGYYSTYEVSERVNFWGNREVTVREVSDGESAASSAIGAAIVVTIVIILAMVVFVVGIFWLIYKFWKYKKELNKLRIENTERIIRNLNVSYDRNSPWGKMVEYVKLGKIFKAKKLLKGYDIDLNRKINNVSLLHIAILTDRKSFVRFLLKNKVEVSPHDIAAAISVRNNSLLTIFVNNHHTKLDTNHLIFAIKQKNNSAIKKLVESNHVDLSCGPIHEAIKSDNIKLVKYLLRKGARLTEIYEKKSVLAYSDEVANKKIKKVLAKYVEQ